MRDLWVILASEKNNLLPTLLFLTRAFLSHNLYFTGYERQNLGVTLHFYFMSHWSQIHF